MSPLRLPVFLTKPPDRSDRRSKSREKPAKDAVAGPGVQNVEVNTGVQLVNARYEKGAVILTSNRSFKEWGQIFGDNVVAAALLDRLLHHAVVIHIEGNSYRLRAHRNLMPENLAAPQNPNPDKPSRRRGRPRKDQT